MRSPALIVVLAASVAHADAKNEVDALVRSEVTAVLDENIALARTSDFVAVEPSFATMNRRMDFYGGWADNVAQKVEKLVVVAVDAKTAWFHGVVDGAYDYAPCDGMGGKCAKTKRVHKTWRVSGVARDDHGWKIAAMMWSGAVSDAELFKLADDDPSHELVVEPRDDPAKVVAGWFAGTDTIARSISSSAQVIANGTAPGEIGQGAAAGKLAKAWDGLKLWTPKVEGTTWGSVAFVTATVGIAGKKPKTAVMMKLGVVVVKENGNWRWVAINFAPPDR